MTIDRHWYAIGTRVYAQRNNQATNTDPIVAACATTAAATHIAQLHNQARINADTHLTRTGP